MLRAFARLITAMTEPKRVPIPKNGVDYRGKVVLAPMVRSGELPSRLLALKYGADLVWGPETVDRSMIGTTRYVNERTSCIEWRRFSSSQLQENEGPRKESVIYRLHPTLEHKRLIFQIGTANPEYAVEAAKLVAADVAGIDVNAGCPKPFSTSGGMGAALLKTPDKLCAILEALVKEVGSVYEIGISVKIRILDTAEQTEALVRKLVATGITGLTVHCRTTPMRPRERAIRDQLRMVANVCHEAGVACLMNGDVVSRTAALSLIPEYGVDGAMIATSAEKNSSVFRPEEEGGRAPWREVVDEYIKLSVGVENRWGNTKFLLAQLMPGKDPLFNEMNKAKCYLDLVKSFGLTDLEEDAKRVDKMLGIPGLDTKAARKARAKEMKEVANARAKRSASELQDNSTSANDSVPADEPNPSKRIKLPSVESETLPAPLHQASAALSV